MIEGKRGRRKPRRKYFFLSVIVSHCWTAKASPLDFHNSWFGATTRLYKAISPSITRPSHLAISTLVCLVVTGRSAAPTNWLCVCVCVAARPKYLDQIKEKVDVGSYQELKVKALDRDGWQLHREEPSS